MRTGGFNDAMPSKEIPDAKKGTGYVIDWLMAMYRSQAQYPMYHTIMGENAPRHDDNTGITRTLWHNFADIQRAREFMNGLGDALELKKVHALSGPEANGIETARAVHWRQPKFMLRIMDRMRNNLRDRATNLIVTALDRDSVTRANRAKYSALAKAKAANNPRIKALDQAMGVEDQMALPSDQPQNVSEWEQWGSNLKDATAMTIEMALMALDGMEDYRQRMRPLMASAIVSDGVLAMASMVNAKGVPERMFIPIENLVFPYTTNNWDDMPWGGYLRWMTSGEIAHEAGGQVSESQFKRIEEKTNLALPDEPYGGNPLQRRWPNHQRSGRTLVFTGYFKDHNHYAAGDDGNGNRVRVTGEYEYRKGNGQDTIVQDDKVYANAKATRYEVVYQGNWVVGTGEGKGNDGEEPIHWGCGLAYNQPRMKNALGKTRIPMVVKAYRMNEMRVRSAAMIAQDHYHPITQIEMEIAHLLNKIIPPGAILDETWLDDVLADGGKQASRSDILKNQQDTGYLFLRFKNLDDPMNPDKRVRVEMHDAMIPRFSELTTLLREKLSLFEMAMGYNPAASGGTLEERTAARNAQIMVRQSDLAQAYLTEVLDSVEQELYLIMFGQLQGAMAAGNDFEGYATLYGETLPQLVRLTADTDPGSIGLHLEVRMTDEERDAIMQDLATARANGEITGDDYISIRGMRNLKQMARTLELRRQTRSREEHERRMQIAQQQTQGNMEAANVQVQGNAQRVQMEVQARLQEMQMKHEKQMAELQLKLQADSQNTSAQFQGDLAKMMMQFQQSVELLNMKLAGEKELASDANRSRERVAESVNETDLEIAERNARSRAKGESEKGD